LVPSGIVSRYEETGYQTVLLFRASSFQRIFGATIFFGTDMQRERAAVVHQARFNFMSEARIWYSRDADQATLPGGFQNEIVLSHEFFSEIGLVNQLGSSDYARPRKFRERLEGWLDLVRSMWPECPAVMDTTGTGLWVDRAAAVLPAGEK